MSTKTTSKGDCQYISSLHFYVSISVFHKYLKRRLGNRISRKTIEFLLTITLRIVLYLQIHLFQSNRHLLSSLNADTSDTKINKVYFSLLNGIHWRR